MEKVLTEMISQHNLICSTLKNHCCGWRVVVYVNSGRQFCGEVSVKNDNLYINGRSMKKKLITDIYYTDRKRNGNNNHGKDAL